MIPKIIHYVWFGGEIPEFNRKCIETFSINKDFEIMAHINPISDNLWINSCLKNKQYAYASDLYRLIVLQKYGGIYLDTDCECIKPFDDNILNTNFLIGWELKGIILCTSTFGSEKNSNFLQKLINWYNFKEYADKYKDMYWKLYSESGEPYTLYSVLNNNALFAYTLMNDIKENKIIPLDREYFVAHKSKNSSYKIFTLLNDFKKYKKNNLKGYDITDNTYVKHYCEVSWFKQ